MVAPELKFEYLSSRHEPFVAPLNLRLEPLRAQLLSCNSATRGGATNASSDCCASLTVRA
jgi:hypothetical protein